MGPDAGFPYPGQRNAPLTSAAEEGAGFGSFTGGIPEMRPRKGFTLLDLLVAIAITGSLLGLGVPAFGDTMERVRTANALHAISASMAIARSTAITRNHPITVCPSRDGRTCRSDRRWEDGWIVFVDPDRSGTPAAPDTVLRVHQGIGPGMALASSWGRHRVRYLPNGSAAGTNLTLRLCSQRRGREVAHAIVSNTGRLRTRRLTAGAPCS